MPHATKRMDVEEIFPNPFHKVSIDQTRNQKKSVNKENFRTISLQNTDTKIFNRKLTNPNSTVHERDYCS